MACEGCKERARLVGEAVIAYRNRDRNSVRSNLQAIAASLGQDVKTLAATLRLSDRVNREPMNPVSPPKENE